MKTILLISFLSFTVLTSGKTDRDIIKKIDDINSSALVLFNNKEIVNSFKKFNNAKALADSINDSYGSATANFNLGNIYYLMENYESAKKHYQLTLDGILQINDKYLISSSYLNLAKIYRDQNQNSKSIKYFLKALNASANFSGFNGSEKDEIKNTHFEARINLCELNIKNNNLEEALIELLKLGDYLKLHDVNLNLRVYYNYIYGKYYAKKELFNSANTKFKEAILLLESNKEAIDLALISNLYMQRSISLAKSGKSTEAYIALLQHNNYKNQLSSEEKNRQDLILKSKFLIEDYKNEAEAANIERLHQLEIANKFRKINIAIIITLLLLVISIIAIYKSYRSKGRLSKILEAKNKELEIAKDEALKTSELKSKFISNVTHELRTPLYGVVGISSLLLENNTLSNRDKKHLKSLKYSGDYLLNLVNDILQVGKMEANKIELKNVSVNLKEVLDDIANSFSYRLVETNNKIKISIDTNVPQQIKCDKVRLSQILINLIGNSVKFTSSGVINLRVKLLRLDTKNVGLCFEVEDNGAGIPKEKFDVIFDNFSQLEDSNVNYQGTGLGLSITKNLIELFGSEIRLESTLNVGTKVSFEVDFELDKNISEVNAEDAQSMVKKLSNTKSQYKILVAEDNKINQVVTKNLLKKKGYSCTIVQNGKEAIEQVKTNDYDLVLMDINMPIMDGNEATQTIRQFDKALPIVALTASDIDEIRQSCMTIGFNDIVIKPFDNYEFFQIINQNIQNYRAINNLSIIKAS